MTVVVKEGDGRGGHRRLEKPLRKVIGGENKRWKYTLLVEIDGCCDEITSTTDLGK